jgi:hypothetical protein
MENFILTKFLQMPEAPIVIKASSRDHSDVHYLYRLRKAARLLVGDDGLKGFSEGDLIKIHEAIVRSLVSIQISHYYDTYDNDLDDKLPMDLKMASSGWEPPKGASIFDLEADELAIRTLLMEQDVLYLWTPIAARKSAPETNFLDTVNKRYPYKNFDGTINCSGLVAAYKATSGAIGVPKKLEIAAEAKRLLKSKCGNDIDEDKDKEVDKKKKEEPARGKLTKI